MRVERCKGALILPLQSLPFMKMRSQTNCSVSLSHGEIVSLSCFLLHESSFFSFYDDDTISGCGKVSGCCYMIARTLFIHHIVPSVCLVQIIEWFQTCYLDHRIAKFFSECTGLKINRKKLWSDVRILKRVRS